MTDSQGELLNKLLVAVANEQHRLPNIGLTAFRAMKGKNSDGQLMVVGRAVNGWADEWLASSIQHVDERKRILNQIAERSSTCEGGCPMSWVTKYWKVKPFCSGRSAFWRVAKNVAMKLGIADQQEKPWSSRLIWSNLYKVSPWKGGNPSNQLLDIQRPICRKLLLAEVQEWMPKRILFLTGWWMDRFLEELPPSLRVDARSSQNHGFSFVRQLGYFQMNLNHQISFVVAEHPQCKRESSIAQEVISAFGVLE